MTKTLLAFLAVILLAFFCMGCPPKTIPQGAVVEIDTHIFRLPANVPYNPDRNGYFLSDEVLAKLLQWLEGLQHQLDIIPKASVNQTDGVNLQGFVSAGSGQNPDDSDRLLEYNGQ